MYRTMNFDSHFQGFNLRKRNDNFHVPLFPHQLPDHQCFHIHNPVDLNLASGCNIDVNNIFVVPKFEYSIVLFYSESLLDKLSILKYKHFKNKS